MVKGPGTDQWYSYSGAVVCNPSSAQADGTTDAGGNFLQLSAV